MQSASFSSVVRSSAESVSLQVVQRQAEQMTPFVDIPIDPAWPEIVRSTYNAQPAEFFRQYFDGRLPSGSERLAFIEQSVRRLTPLRVFQNSVYRVEVIDTPPITPMFIHLDIRRLDGGTCKEWADLQRIKNEIVGPEYEAVELFPAESRLVNTGNQYHLWVHSSPSYRFPIGWAQRLVFSEPLKVSNGQQQTVRAADNRALESRVLFGNFISTPVA
jgi:hypothetical protein